MSTSEAGAATVIPIRDDAAAAAGKAPVAPAPAPAPAEASAAAAPAPAVTARKPRGLPLLLRSARGEGGRRCVALLDFLLRVAAFGPTLAAAISTGTDDETLTVFTQFFQFHANYADFPAFTFFMVVNAVAAGYLVLSLPFSAVGVVRPKAIGVRLLLLVCDMVMLALLTAAASSAAAIVYLAHTGNQRANWVAICMQFNGFCQRSSGAVVGSFLGVLVFMLLVVMAACSIRRR